MLESIPRLIAYYGLVAAAYAAGLVCGVLLEEYYTSIQPLSAPTEWPPGQMPLALVQVANTQEICERASNITWPYRRELNIASQDCLPLEIPIDKLKIEKGDAK